MTLEPDIVRPAGLPDWMHKDAPCIYFHGYLKQDMNAKIVGFAPNGRVRIEYYWTERDSNRTTVMPNALRSGSLAPDQDAPARPDDAVSDEVVNEFTSALHDMLGTRTDGSSIVRRRQS